MRIILAATTALILAGSVGPQSRPVEPPLKLERVVMLMRHGVRPPTKAPAMPAGVAAQGWPDWSVAPGYLTPHGATAVVRIATSDRAGWIAAGLLPPTGCATMRIVADSDQRTIETARAYAAALAPGCTVPIERKPQGVGDPLFSPIDEGAVTIDPAKARAAVLADLGAGGIAAVEARERPVLRRLDAILCGPATTACGIGAAASGLAAASPGKRPKLAGALDRGSTVAQILLLEYADGKPMAEVGWGRATPADITAASSLHATEFRIVARPRYVAARNLAGIGALMRGAIVDPRGPAVTMLAGHDTDVASLGGLLDLHWTVPGLATDDPSPGGALSFERLGDGRGGQYVRAVYRSQSLEQIRTLAPLGGAETPYRVAMPLPGCTARHIVGLCTLAQFDALMTTRLARE